MLLQIAFRSMAGRAGSGRSFPPNPAPSILKPTCVSRIIFAENQSEPEPTMKRPRLFSTAVISILFLPVFLCNAQETNTLPNGGTYIGEVKDGKANGRGTQILPNGRKYVGEFRDGLPNGHGTLTVPHTG